MGLVKSTEAQGKMLLIDAALRLAVRTRSLQALGIREIGRQAGLNPNTFYRHFKNLDDLGLAIIQAIVEQLREPLRALRRKAMASVAGAGVEAKANTALIGFDLDNVRQVAAATVRLFFRFVAEHPSAFMLGVRELHGASPVLRQALKQAMADFATDMAEDIREQGMLDMLDDCALQQLSTTTIREMFQLSMDYIEHPDLRTQIEDEAETMIVTLITGAVTLSRLRPK